MQQYEELARLMLQRDKEGRPFTFYHYMIDLTGGPCIYKRISGCGSGTEYMAVTPWGDLYPCHQFVGDEKFKLGNIWDGVTNHSRAGRNLPRLQRLCPAGVPGLLGKALLLRRVRRQRLPRHRLRPGRIRRRLRPVPQAHGVRHRRGGGP